MKGACLLFLLMFFPLSFAANVQYEIGEKGVFAQIEYNESEFLLIDLPSDAKVIENIKNEKISFFSKSLLEKSRKGNFLINKNRIHKNSHIIIILPKSASISDEHFLFPSNYKLITNGENIIIEFENSTENELLIPYKEKHEFNFLFISIILVSFLALFFYEKFSKRNLKYTQNLYRDEKKIMDFLIKKKKCWTKEIAKELNLSKVKLCRKLRSLEQRGLIEKEPFGNENRIKLKK